MYSTTPTLLAGHREGVVCLSVDGGAPHLLAAGDEGGACRLHDVRERKAVRAVGRLADASGARDVGAVSLSAHSLLVACGAAVLDFDLRAGGVVLAGAAAAAHAYDELGDDVNALARHPKGRHALAADDCGAVTVLELDARTRAAAGPRKASDGHATCCSSVAWREYGSATAEFVSGGLDSTVAWWEGGAKRPRRAEACRVPLDEPNADAAQLVNPPMVHGLAFSPKGRVLAAALGDGTVGLFAPSARALPPCRLRGGHSLPVAGVAWAAGAASSALPLLASVGNDCAVCVWEARDPVQTEAEGAAAGALAQTWAHTAKPNAVLAAAAAAPCGGFFVADVDGGVALYQVEG